MTPGIQPSKVKMRLRKKLAIRPVKRTARGGNTTQKKYRSAFISTSSSLASLVERWAFSSDLLHQFFAVRSLQSLDSTANRDKDRVIAFRDRRFGHRYLSPCISRFSHFGLPACPGAAWHRARHYPEDRAPQPSASR